VLLNFAIFLAATGIVVAGLVTWLLRSRAIGSERDRAARAEAALHEERIARATVEAVAARVPGLETKLEELRGELSQQMEANARLEAARQGEQEAHTGQLAAITSLRGAIEKEMHAIASAALKGNEASFLLLAGQAFETHQQAAANLLKEKEQAIANLVNPVASALKEYQDRLGGFEKVHAILANEVQNVGVHARKLVNALQASPNVRGRWGEQQLQNVIELAGMTPHVDYVLQQTIDANEGRLRPDLIIRLPGGRYLVVDAKTPLTAYFDADDAADEEARKQHLRRHSQQVRTHMRQLANKRYWEALQPVTPDFVVMFIPGENFYRAAVEHDPELLQDGLKDGVLIASPTTLIALARTIAFNWRQEKLAEDAQKIARLGRELYQRLATMGDYIVDVGKGLEGTVKHYNRFIGSLESRVLPKARQFTEIEVDGTQEPLPELQPIETEVRQLRADGLGATAPSAAIIPLTIEQASD